MSDTPQATDFRCYRHLDRESFIRCQRCGRTVCAECQTQAAVGVHCPECVREARAQTPRTTPRIINAFIRPGNTPIVSYTLIGLNLFIYLLQIITSQAVFAALAYRPDLTAYEPWRMLTAAFVHSPGSILHIVFNMYSLFIFGPMIEHLIGRGRFVALYLISAFGGSVGVLLLAPNVVVVGASGAIFGLLAAYFVIARKLGGNSTQLLAVIVLNLVIGFVIPNVAWQAHLGGLIVGGAIAFVLVQTRNRRQRTTQLLAIAAIAAALLVVTVIAAPA